MSDTVYPPVVQPPISYPPESKIVLPPEREIVTPEPEPKDEPELFVVQSQLATPRATDPGTHLFNALSVGKAGEAGIALLTKRIYLPFSVGSFNGLPIKFPAGSILLTAYVSVITAFNGATPTVSFGKAAATGEFVALQALGVAGTFKIDITALLQPSYLAYMSAILTTSTAGEAYIALVYSGAPIKTWQ